MLSRNVEGGTSIAMCGGLTGRRWAPADPIRRRSGRDRNDDMGRDGCPRALDLRGVVGRGDGRADAPTVRHRRDRAGGAVAGWVAWLPAVRPRRAALAERHDGLPDHILQIAWRAQQRRLTDVEDAPDASPPEPLNLNPPATGGARTLRA